MQNVQAVYIIYLAPRVPIQMGKGYGGISIETWPWDTLSKYAQIFEALVVVSFNTFGIVD